MPSPRRWSAFGWLLRKDWRDLLVSRAWWAMLAVTGPLVGMSFISGVNAFAEVSAGAGNACGRACAPLVGVWGPTFSVYEIIATLLLPFVVIRLVAGDSQSGALKLELQRPLSAFTRVSSKAVVLMAAWMLASSAALVAMGLWALYGGHTYLPEVLSVVVGHTLNAGLTVALACAIATTTDHPSTAAIVTLAVTIGTWAISLAAAINGGWWESLAAITPVAMVGGFQRGLIQIDIVLVALVLIAAGFAVAARWLRPSVAAGRRALETVLLLGATAAIVALCTVARGSWDLSESRQNSFAEAEEAALERLPGALSISVHLAPQDPRRLELERGPLAKVRRAVPSLQVFALSRTTSGLYESADEGYGDITYTMDGRSETSRMVTDEGVLESIFKVAAVTPVADDEPEYRGHPLTTAPQGAAVIFYGIWPACVAALAGLVLRRHT